MYTKYIYEVYIHAGALKGACNNVFAWRQHHTLASLESTGTPAASTTRTVLTCPFCAARCNAVCPNTLQWRQSAPAWKTTRAIGRGKEGAGAGGGTQVMHGRTTAVW